MLKCHARTYFYQVRLRVNQFDQRVITMVSRTDISCIDINWGFHVTEEVSVSFCFDHFAKTYACGTIFAAFFTVRLQDVME